MNDESTTTRGERARDLRGFVAWGDRESRRAEERAARERVDRELASRLVGAGWFRRLWLRPLLWIERELRVRRVMRESDERLYLRAR